MPNPSIEARLIAQVLVVVSALAAIIQPDSQAFALCPSDNAYKPDSQQSVERNRGAYLVNGPAACGACHTPKSPQGGSEAAHYLTGADLQGWFAPSITGDKRVGLGNWSVEDVVAYLKTGHNRIAAATGPMAGIVAASTSQMPDGDLRAIAIYLKSVPEKPAVVRPLPADSALMIAGHAIYRDRCAACHALDGRGEPRLFPSLAESSNVLTVDPETLIRIVLEGARSVATSGEPTAPGMPSFAWDLDDAEVAAVLTYIRNDWGRSASVVSPQEVKKVRSHLAASPN